ncbi:MAG: DEAD/DEAH box helicase [Candidatus Thorarchaeota archaeon]
MTTRGREEEGLVELRTQLKALSNRYAIDILRVLNPETGEMIHTLGWDEVFDGILKLGGVEKPQLQKSKEKTQTQAQYEKQRKALVSGGTIYETMTKLERAGFVLTAGTKGRKNREFIITQQGRLALSAISGLIGPTMTDTDVQRAAKILLKHKNFVSLLPAQAKFLREIGSVDGNLVIQMPPGSGKTFLAMIVILLRLQSGIRCLYLTPYTSLNRQIIDEYGELFEELGYSVVRHDGQHRASSNQLENANLVVAVFESFLSSLLRNNEWTKNFGLAVIDELTELDSQGPVVQARNLGTDRSTKLDCLITLLKDDMQMLTLSSRFGVTEEIERWLDARVFRPSFRLTPDEFIVTGDSKSVEITSSDGTQRSEFEADRAVDAVFQHIGDFSEKSVLFVVGSRFDAEAIACRLSQSHPREVPSDLVTSIVGPEENLPITSRLLEPLSKGTAFHHSGLDASVRARLERSIKRGEVRTVVSTTGITAGISFPFDCVVILFDRTLYYIAARSRYLQIAGRIGEYHLTQNGGSVYLVFLEPRQFQDAREMEEVLLHKPLEPLNPGDLYPSLVTSLIMREAVKKRSVDKKTLQRSILGIIKESFRGTIQEDYGKQMTKMFSTLFNWLVKEGVLVQTDTKYSLTKDARLAVVSGIGMIDYLKVRKTLGHLTQDANDDELIELLLHFELPQSIRPRSTMPTDIEVKASGLEGPDEWYRDLVNQREVVKREVLTRWIDEKSVEDVIAEADQIARTINVGGRPIGGADLGEGDLEYFLEACSNLSVDISKFLDATKNTKASKRLMQFSRQLRYGVRGDLAESDLMDLEISRSRELPPSRILRSEARTLYDNGYRTITEVVRKEIDPDQEGLARERFAMKSGLDLQLAKATYRAAIEHLRTHRE